MIYPSQGAKTTEPDQMRLQSPQVVQCIPANWIHALHYVTLIAAVQQVFYSGLHLRAALWRSDSTRPS